MSAEAFWTSASLCSAVDPFSICCIRAVDKEFGRSGRRPGRGLTSGMSSLCVILLLLNFGLESCANSLALKYLMVLAVLSVAPLSPKHLQYPLQCRQHLNWNYTTFLPSAARHKATEIPCMPVLLGVCGFGSLWLGSLKGLLVRYSDEVPMRDRAQPLTCISLQGLWQLLYLSVWPNWFIVCMEQRWFHCVKGEHQM